MPRPPPDPARRVAILLSTYDGARFLPEQLGSLLAQTHASWTLHWRDDGSRDGTAAIMRAFAAGPARGRCVEHAAPAGNVGVLASYMRLLRDVAPTLDEADAVAFADQDDVWLPGKLARGMAMLPAGKGAGQGTAQNATLYCARYWRVDAGLNRVAQSERLRRPAGFPQALTQNIATGCTIMLTPAAARLVAASAPPPGTLHDWWCYLLVSAAGGAVLRDETPVLLYRQHQGNAVGAPPGFAARAIAALRRGPTQFATLLRAHVASLRAQPQALSTASADVLAALDRDLSGGVASRVRALATPGLRRQGWWETGAFRLWVLIG